MTALRFSVSAFTPSQANVSQPGFMKATAGQGPFQVAQACLEKLPAITTSSIIHDNGCGDGNVTRLILSQYPTAADYPNRIHATDIAAELVEVLTKDAKTNGWPVSTALMPAQNLSIPDQTFTHSIMNCVILRLSDADAIKACSEMHRTLRPGGVAIVSGWADVPHRAALAAAHSATRPAGSEPLVGGAVRWVDGKLLRQSMEEGGFKGGVTMTKVKSVSEVADLQAWVRYMWSLLGRMESGWIPSDEENWEKAVKIFGESMKKQDGVELLEGGKARMTSWCWVAMAEKE